MERKESTEHPINQNTDQNEEEEIPKHWSRWKHVILTAEMLSADLARNPNRQIEIELMLRSLESVEEMFPKALDPVDDIEGFAFRQFCRAFRKSLEIFIEQNLRRGRSSS